AGLSSFPTRRSSDLDRRDAVRAAEAEGHLLLRLLRDGVDARVLGGLVLGREHGLERPAAVGARHLPLPAGEPVLGTRERRALAVDRKSTRLNSSHVK